MYSRPPVKKGYAQSAAKSLTVPPSGLLPPPFPPPGDTPLGGEVWFTPLGESQKERMVGVRIPGSRGPRSPFEKGKEEQATLGSALVVCSY